MKDNTEHLRNLRENFKVLYVTFENYSLTKLPKFDVMQVQVDIGFDQLVQLAKRLPATQWTKLKEEVDNKKTAHKEVSF